MTRLSSLATLPASTLKSQGRRMSLGCLAFYIPQCLRSLSCGIRLARWRLTSSRSCERGLDTCLLISGMRAQDVFTVDEITKWICEHGNRTKEVRTVTIEEVELQMPS